MTISTTTTYDPDIDVIVKDAMVLSSLMNEKMNIGDSQWVQQASQCRRYLADIMHEIPSRGVILREARLTTQTLTADDYTYTLDASILDIIGDAMYIAAGETVTAAAGETLVTQITLADWQRLSDKSATASNPTMFLPYKGGSAIELRLWPTPDEAGTIRFNAHTQSADVQDGSATVDLQTYWRSYLKFEIAHRFALSNGVGLDVVQYLSLQAEQRFRDCKRKSQTKAPFQASLNHRTGRR